MQCAYPESASALLQMPLSWTASSWSERQLQRDKDQALGWVEPLADVLCSLLDRSDTTTKDGTLVTFVPSQRTAELYHSKIACREGAFSRAVLVEGYQSVPLSIQLEWCRMHSGCCKEALDSCLGLGCWQKSLQCAPKYKGALFLDY